MALTQEEKVTFDALTSGEYMNFALLEAEYEGQRAAVIVAVNRNNGEYHLAPLAKLIDEVDRERLSCDGKPLGMEI